MQRDSLTRGNCKPRRTSRETQNREMLLANSPEYQLLTPFLLRFLTGEAGEDYELGLLQVWPSL